MKIKSPAETAQLGKSHAYLGHFAKAKHINRGHNSDPVGDLSLPSDKRRQRLHEEFVAGAVKDAEAGLNPGTKQPKDRTLSQAEQTSKEAISAGARRMLNADSDRPLKYRPKEQY